MVATEQVPRILYGTAWKEDQTQPLTATALQQGFRGIDTANQRRHYDEAAVGRAVTQAIASGLVHRDDLFLQTKFTFRRGQDHRLPYDPDAPIGVQVEQSFASSKTHLGVDRIDSYLLHGPSSSVGLHSDDWAAWRAMESIHDQGGARLLGISNVSLEQLQLLCREARIRPSFVQNRCYASRGWDRQVRQFCAENSLIYQGFSLLTANRDVVTSTEVTKIAKRCGKSNAQIIFRFAIHVGILPLTGTTKSQHMQADLDVFSFSLDSEEVALIERIAAR